jgi:hypothetical protein
MFCSTDFGSLRGAKIARTKVMARFAGIATMRDVVRMIVKLRNLVHFPVVINRAKGE